MYSVPILSPPSSLPTSEGTVLSSLSECSQPLSEGSTVYEPSVLDVDFNGKAIGVWVSCAEIYNEFIYDLFAEIPVKRVTRQKDRSGHPQRQALRLAEDKNHNVFIKGESCTPSTAAGRGVCVTVFVCMYVRTCTA